MRENPDQQILFSGPPPQLRCGVCGGSEGLRPSLQFGQVCQVCRTTPPLPSVRGSETSEAAAEAAVPNAGTQRRRVWDFLEERAEKGATDEEMQEHLGMDPSTQRPRRVELVERRLVYDSGRKRETRSGRKAVVWEARRG